MKLFITLLGIAMPILLHAQEIQGTWNGNLEIQKDKFMLFVFHIHQGDGLLLTEVDVPSQQQKGLKTKQTFWAHDSLSIDASNLGFRFKGLWNKASNQIDGMFYEGLNSQKLNLGRDSIREARPNRPQEPSKPYPYTEKEVHFTNPDAHITLAGTLTIPTAGDGTAVILISGSGPQDRDETIAGHKPFLILADHLTRNGIAVLRVDDRGFGASTGVFDSATTYDFSTDVRCAISFLKTQAGIDPKKIGLIGHSEGAIIAPMVANASNDVAFIVLLAGTGVPGKSLSLMQAITMRGFPVPDEAAYASYVKGAIDIAAAGKPVGEVRTELTAYYKRSPILKSLVPAGVNPDDFIAGIVKARTTPWIRYFYNYNPADEVRKVRVPVLALYGSKDTQVLPSCNLPPVKEALEHGRCKDFSVKQLDGLNHLFQEAKTGTMQEYVEIEQTFSPVALNEISGWIKMRF